MEVDDRLALRIADDRAAADRAQVVADLDLGGILVAGAVAEMGDALDVEPVTLAVLAIGDEADDALAVLAPDRRGAGVVALEVGEGYRLGLDRSGRQGGEQRDERKEGPPHAV